MKQKQFRSSQIKQLSKNIFTFVQKGRVILFNRITFQQKYLEDASFAEIKKIAKEMERETPKIRFSLPQTKKFRIEITFNCNLNCDYCLVFKNNLVQLNNSMNENTARKTIAFYKKNIRTHCREAVIMPDMVNLILAAASNKDQYRLQVQKESEKN